jgi:hypothetical protein
MHQQRPEALLYFPVLIIGGMVTLGGLAWLYEKTRKKITHPRLGTMTFYGDNWAAMVAHYSPGQPTVRVEIPGTRGGPNDEDLASFEALWARMPQVVDSVRPYAIEDLEDAHDAVLGTKDEALTRAIVERIAGQPRLLDADWVLSGVGLHAGRQGSRHWCLEFAVSWDAEHQRSAYLDPDGGLLRYDLSCTVVDL